MGYQAPLSPEDLGHIDGGVKRGQQQFQKADRPATKFFCPGVR